MRGVGHTARNITVALLCAFLAACSPVSALKSLTGGPNVAANVQAGKTNTQTIGQTSVTEQKLIRPQARSIEQSTGSTRVRSDRVETVNVNEKDSPWIVFALVLVAVIATAGWIHGWLTPSPRERKLNRRIEDLERQLMEYDAVPEKS